MKIEELVNNGFIEFLPVYYNKVTVIDYNKTENQIMLHKNVKLEKYNLSRYIVNKCYKHIAKISK